RLRLSRKVCRRTRLKQSRRSLKKSAPRPRSS
ncbi:uncharacterized protein METZ01_LOCUS57841, partial [marine metagenome]